MSAGGVGTCKIVLAGTSKMSHLHDGSWAGQASLPFCVATGTLSIHAASPYGLSLVLLNFFKVSKLSRVEPGRPSQSFRSTTGTASLTQILQVKTTSRPAQIQKKEKQTPPLHGGNNKNNVDSFYPSHLDLSAFLFSFSSGLSFVHYCSILLPFVS